MIVGTGVPDCPFGLPILPSGKGINYALCIMHFAFRICGFAERKGGRRATMIGVTDIIDGEAFTVC